MWLKFKSAIKLTLSDRKHPNFGSWRDAVVRVVLDTTVHDVVSTSDPREGVAGAGVRLTFASLV